jgi:hypothetical protein
VDPVVVKTVSKCNESVLVRKVADGLVVKLSFLHEKNSMMNITSKTSFGSNFIL